MIYSLIVLENMRVLIRSIIVSRAFGGLFESGEIQAQVERELMTHISNGTDIDSLREEEERLRKIWFGGAYAKKG